MRELSLFKKSDAKTFVELFSLTRPASRRISGGADIVEEVNFQSHISNISLHSVQIYKIRCDDFRSQKRVSGVRVGARYNGVTVVTNFLLLFCLQKRRKKKEE